MMCYIYGMSERKQTVSLRLPPDLIQYIRQEAERNTRDFSRQVLVMLTAQAGTRSRRGAKGRTA